jgi:hypothetical protein
VSQLLSVPFGAGVEVPALFRAEPAELAVVLLRTLVPVALFRALVAVVLADPAVVRLAAVVRGAGRTGAVLSAAFGAVLSAAFGAVLAGAFGSGLAGAFGSGLAGAFGSGLVTAFGAALTPGVLGPLSVTASCHALRLGTSGELSR